MTDPAILERRVFYAGEQKENRPGSKRPHAQYPFYEPPANA